jgi:NADH:ubiquinone oxidoreductase subunit 2 (subunit N)
VSEPTRQVLDAAVLFAWLPLIAIAIPLLIASLLGMPRLRAVVASIAALAAVPALLIAMSVPDTGLALPVVLLGSSLELDAIGRPFLFAVALLWLTAGVLGRAGLRSQGAALLYLLAMSGTFAMALAGDLLLFLLGSTVSGYALYGLLGGRGGAQALVRLLVLSDLMLFESLLLLVYAGTGLEFASLPQSIAAAQDNGLLLILFLIGFGAKAGLLGVHYWLAPSISSARHEQRLALMAFVLTAGLLPWTRLLAPGAIDWPEAAVPLQWLALAMASFALTVGLLQRRLGALAGYGVMAVSALWLGLLGAAMSGSVVAEPTAAKLATAIAQSGLVLSALLLIVTPTSPGRWRLLRPATAAVGALLLVDAVLTALAPFAPGSHPTAPAVSVLALICAAAGLLLGRTLYLALSPAQSFEAEADAVPAALLLILAAALMAVRHSGGVNAPWLEGTAVLLGGVVGALFEPLVRRRSSLPQGWAGKPITALLGVTAQRLQRGLITPLGHWRTQMRSLVVTVFSTRALQRGLAPAEAALRIWRIAVVLVLMTGAIAALILFIGAASS